MRGKSVVHSSGNDGWRTPPWLYKYFDDQYHFGLDAAASDENHLAPAYFTEEDDALKHSWRGFGNVFLNPPYSTRLNRAFMAKVAEELDGTFYIVTLVAAKTSTVWWQDVVMPLAMEICFVRGRVQFVGADNCAPFPSAVVIFGTWHLSKPRTHSLIEVTSLLQPHHGEKHGTAKM